MVTQLFFNLLFDNLDGLSGNLEITHIALGTGTTAASKSDTSLQTEVFRKPISSKSRSNSQFTVKLSLAPSEAVFNIREVGIFANATDTPGSGTLLARGNVNIDKNASTQLLIPCIITAQ